MPLDTADHLELLDLYARYSFAFDQGELEAWAGLFTPDGRFELAGGPVMNGTDELVSFAKAMYPRVPGIRHLPSNIQVEAVPGGGARGRAYILAVGHGDEGGLRVITMGTYDDTFTRTADGWRIRTRTFTAWADMHSAGGLLVLPRLGGC